MSKHARTTTLKIARTSDVAQLLLMAAPSATLKEIGLSSATAAKWAAEMTPSTPASTHVFYGLFASALHYATRTPAKFMKCASLMATIATPPEVIRELVQLTAATESEATEALIHSIASTRASAIGRNASTARHRKSGSAHEKANAGRKAIRSIWASGKYSDKDTCAEQEYDALGISFSTARKALRNAPDPINWVAKERKRRSSKA